MNWTKLLVLFFILFLSFINVNAQIVIKNYSILEHSPNATCNTAFSPGLLIGEDAFIDNIGDTEADPAHNVEVCTTVVYEWESCLIWDFSSGVNHNLSDQRDFDPGLITETIYFRRYTKFTCELYSHQYKEEWSGITMNVYPLSVGGSITPPQNICSGTSPAKLKLSGHIGHVVKWQKASDAGFTTAINIPVTSATLLVASIGTLTQDTWFRAVVQSGYYAEACPAVNSDIVKITVYPLPVCSIMGADEVGQATTNTFDGSPGMSSYAWTITPANASFSGSSTGSSVSVIAGIGCNTVFDLSLTITDLNGCISTCSKTVTILDNQPPTFTLPLLNASYCVVDISEAVYNEGAENTPNDLTTLRPDFYLFSPSNTLLNISAQTDNCALAANPIAWTIHFADTTPDLSGSGQLSAYVPVLPLTGIPFPVGTNTITYTLTDAAGNLSITESVDLIVAPRPDILKLF